ncbi:MAG TPA: glycosyltransferase family 2 protein [Solirubrobacterales bacterium]|nr:glycosyltransferase family 2 protein [Solirubrobacterales bacterium]
MTAVSIVIPVHGKAHLTERCLDLVLAHLPEDCEVVVVDDASGDGTPELLGRYGDRIRSIRLDDNVGFAAACNRGVGVATGRQLVFLNNDTEPRPGWLEALRRYASEHPDATVVGAKLLYPSGAVQHAGVVFGQDGYPHHLYAGFPADHPAVCHPRRLQAVTGACMLVGRDHFERAGGFDAGYLNSLEDVDLCLRIAEAGGEVHYCPDAVVVHLESASRGRSDRFERSVTLYRERWRARVRRDDLDAYVGDGLLAVEYADSYPARIAIDPLLAIVASGREEEIERLLEGYARQSSDLLAEVVRLTVASAGKREDAAPGAGEPATFDRASFLARARRIEAEVRELQVEAKAAGGVEPGPRLGYGHLVESVRDEVERHVPLGAEVLVVSRGDRELVRLDGRRATHFPQDGRGGYAGHHPAGSAEAIAELERLREEGAQYLVFPPTARWWRDHYDEFTAHLDDRHRRLPAAGCEIYELGRRLPGDPEANRMPA